MTLSQILCRQSTFIFRKPSTLGMRCCNSVFFFIVFLKHPFHRQHNHYHHPQPWQSWSYIMTIITKIITRREATSILSLELSGFFRRMELRCRSTRTRYRHDPTPWSNIRIQHHDPTSGSYIMILHQDPTLGSYTMIPHHDPISGSHIMILHHDPISGSNIRIQHHDST